MPPSGLCRYQTYMHAKYPSIYMHAHTRSHIHTHMCIYVCVCVCAYMHVYGYIHYKVGVFLVFNVLVFLDYYRKHIMPTTGYHRY